MVAEKQHLPYLVWKYENIASHCEAVDVLLKIPSTIQDVGDILNVANAETKAESRQMLLLIISGLLLSI